MCWAGWSRALAFNVALVLPLGLVRAAEPIDDSFTLGTWHQRIFGSDYRQLWHTPITVRELDLLNTAGGLTPVREVGQRQTPGLAFKGANGQAYSFRSVRKDPARALPEHLHDTPIATVIADQASADFPAASLVAGPLGQAAGLLTPAPRVVRLPDSPLLGEFRARFAGRLGTFEHYPTMVSLQAAEMIGGWDIFDRLQQGAHEQIDTRLYLRARLLDLYLGDWDRHTGQWRWVRFRPGEPWVPIPEDRDHAFSNYDGWMMNMWRDREPRFVQFGEHYASLEGAAWRGREMDRRLLGELGQSAFLAEAHALQRALSEEVLSEALANLPVSWQPLIAQRLLRKLQVRRDALPQLAGDYYRFLAAEVDVFGTDQAAHYRLQALGDGEIKLTIFQRPENSVACAQATQWPIQFSRTLSPEETRELRVYMGGGHDSLAVDERGSQIRTHFVSKAGPVHICDGESASAYQVRGGPGAGLVLAPEVRLSPAQNVDELQWLQGSDEGAAVKARRDWGRTSYGEPQLGYVTELGVFAGYHRVWEGFGFRRQPFAQQHRAGGMYSVEQRKGAADYRWRRRFENRPAGLTFTAAYDGLAALNYYGFGNNTPQAQAEDFYDVNSDRTELSIVYDTNSPFGDWQLAALARYTWTEDSGFIAVDQPLGFETTGQLGLSVDYLWQRREGRRLRDMAPSDDVSRYSVSAEQPGYDVNVQYHWYPGVIDLDKPYSTLQVEGRSDTRLWRELDRLSARLGYQQNWGPTPYFDAAVIGSQEVRGLPESRYTGDAAVYANLVGKFDVGRLQLIVPGRWGAKVRADAGRVFVRGEDSRIWHPSIGAGVWWLPVGSEKRLNLYVARSRDYTRYYLTLGAKF